MIDWLSQDEALIAIRSRESTDRPLRAVSDQTKRVVKYANMVGGPLAIVLLGLFVWQARKRRSFEL